MYGFVRVIVISYDKYCSFPGLVDTRAALAAGLMRRNAIASDLVIPDNALDPLIGILAQGVTQTTIQTRLGYQRTRRIGHTMKYKPVLRSSRGITHQCLPQAVFAKTVWNHNDTARFVYSQPYRRSSAPNVPLL